MAKMIRFTVTNEAHARLAREADQLGIAFNEYARLRVLGVLSGSAPRVEGTGQVREPIGPRILAEMKRLGWEKITAPHDVRRLASILGSNHRAVHGALGSLVASRKLRRTVYGYFPVAEALPEVAVDIG